jgi:hypothetical protein
VWFRRGRLFMVSPVRGDHRRFQAETPLIALFKFAEPALSFAECAPQPNPQTKKKDVVWFAFNEDRPLFAFAGIWTEFKGDRGTKSKPIPGPHHVYGFLTTSPNAVVEPKRNYTDLSCNGTLFTCFPSLGKSGAVAGGAFHFPDWFALQFLHEISPPTQSHANALPASGRDKFNASVFKGAPQAGRGTGGSACQSRRFSFKHNLMRNKPSSVAMSPPRTVSAKPRSTSRL